MSAACLLPIMKAKPIPGCIGNTLSGDYSDFSPVHFNTCKADLEFTISLGLPSTKTDVNK